MITPKRLYLLAFTFVLSLFSEAQAIPVTSTDPRACSCNFGSGSVSIYDVTDPSASPAQVDPVNFLPRVVAITPDATKALAYNSSNSAVCIIDLTTLPYTIIRTIPIGVDSFGIAITPDGTKACVGNAGRLFPSPPGFLSIIDLTTYETTSILQGTDIWDVAITPDGSKAWVTHGAGDISIVNLTTNPYVVETTFSVGGSFFGIAMTPDNRYALVNNTQDNGSISVVDLSSLNVVQTIPVGTTVESIAISPDSRFACAGTARSDFALIIDLTTQPYTTHTVTIPTTNFDSFGVAITPDSKEAWLCSYDDNLLNSTIYIIDLATRTITHSITAGSQTRSIAITPDQAPTARFSATTNSTTVTLDASSSSSPFGTIAKYTWDFGDGSPVEEFTSPTASHTYANAGTYTITLTVTNSSGTSTIQTFTGKTVSNNGGPPARTTQQISVGRPSSPTKFLGKVKIQNHSKKLLLKTKWNKSSSANVKKYQIFSYKKKIASISARHSRYKTLGLHFQHFPHNHISKKYKRHLSHKYKIRAVSQTGAKSHFTHVRIVK